MSKRVELPPSEFSNAINDIDPDFDFSNWRKSKEWKVFVAGYNAAVTEANNAIKAKYNMGQIKERLFQ